MTDYITVRHAHHHQALWRAAGSTKPGRGAPTCRWTPLCALAGQKRSPLFVVDRAKRARDVTRGPYWHRGMPKYCLI